MNTNSKLLLCSTLPGSMENITGNSAEEFDSLRSHSSCSNNQLKIERWARDRRGPVSMWAPSPQSGPGCFCSCETHHDWRSSLVTLILFASSSSLSSVWLACHTEESAPETVLTKFSFKSQFEIPGMFAAVKNLLCTHTVTIYGKEACWSYPPKLFSLFLRNQVNTSLVYRYL